MGKHRELRGLFCALALCGCLVCSGPCWKSPGRAVAPGRLFATPGAQPAPAVPSSWTAGVARRGSASRAAVTARAESETGPRRTASTAERRDLRSCVPEAERCDGVDNDCDGIRDEAAAAGCGAVHVDRDRDGFGGAGAGCLCIAPADLVSNALDCDDARPDVHPGAREVCDGQVDNDCDGYTDLCGALSHQALAPGDLAIRAVQDQMNDVDDELCEWFEIENRTAHRLELMGLEIRDDGVDGFQIRRSLVLEPGGRVVLGRNSDPQTNGGVAVDYVYSDFILSNAGDSIELRSAGRVIDRKVYAGEAPLP